jgi:nicotinamidase-related amidase
MRTSAIAWLKYTNSRLDEVISDEYLSLEPEAAVMANATLPPDNHAAASSYRSSGFAQQMGWGTRPALLLIDICVAYWPAPGQHSPLSLHGNPDAASVPDSMRRLLEAAREGGVPIIHTKVEYDDMADAGHFIRKTSGLTVWLKGDTRGLDVPIDGLAPRKGEVVLSKKYASGFFGTTLATDLACRGVDTAVICGVSTSGCVRATTLDAMQHGFRPMVVASACGDRTPEIQNANLFDMNAKYADVVSEEEAIQHLQAGWA